MRSTETHEHHERGAGERPRCANPRGMNEKMRRKEADNEDGAGGFWHQRSIRMRAPSWWSSFVVERKDSFSLSLCDTVQFVVPALRSLCLADRDGANVA